MHDAHEQKKANSRSAGRKALMVAVLSGFLTCSAPPPAHADFVTSVKDVAALVAHWAQEHADWLLEAAQWAWQKTAIAIQSAAPIVTKALSSRIEISHKQGEADGELRAAQMAASGEAGGSNLLPTQTQLCSLTHAGQEASVAEGITRQVTGQLSAMSAARGAGVNIDVSSAAYVASEVNDLCKTGFIDTSPTGRYGTIPQTLGCLKLTGAAARFVDADLRLSSLIGKLQYPLPDASHVTPRPDGRYSFIGATMTETAPGLGSEMDYAAAYKFCEHLQPELTSPSHTSGEVRPEHVISIASNSANVAKRAGAAEECFRALAYRTSCPEGTTASLGSTGGASCHEAQKQLCARMTATHAQGGLELTMKGDNPVFAAALANCATEGISPAMYDAIMAYRCHDRNYVYKVLPSITGTGAALERARLFDCPAQESAYRSKMNDEKISLLIAVKNLLVMRTQ